MPRSTSASGSPTATSASLRWCSQAGSPTGCSSGCSPSRSCSGELLGFFDPDGSSPPSTSTAPACGSRRRSRTSPVPPTGTSGGCFSSARGWRSGRDTRARRRSSSRTPPCGRSTPPQGHAPPPRRSRLQRPHDRLHRDDGGRSLGAREQCECGRRCDAARDRRAVRVLAVGVQASPERGGQLVRAGARSR